MTRPTDPINGDPTKIFVPGFSREQLPDGTWRFVDKGRMVEAKMVKVPCPHCGGKGIVLEKVPKTTSEER